MFKEFINYLFIIISFLPLSCNSQTKEYKQIPLLIKNGPNIIYNKFDKISNDNYALLGQTTFYNLKEQKKIIFPGYVTSLTNPLLLNKGKTLILFGDNPIHKGLFIMVDLRNNTHKDISIKGKLNYQSGNDHISNFDIYNDSTIIFNFANIIYIYSVNNDSLQILKEIYGKSLYHLFYNKQKEQVYFGYADKPTYSFGYLGIYFINGDSLRFTDDEAISLNNVSASGDTLLFNSFYGKTGIYDILANKFSYFNFYDSTDKVKLINGYFFNHNILLFQNESGTEFYFYDLYKKKVINKIKGQSSKKDDIYIYNND